MKIGVFSNPNKDVGNVVRDKVLAAANESGIEAEPFCESGKYDFIVSVGGDGTILRVAKHCAQSDIPMLGVNMGTVGFLTEIEPSDIRDALKRLKDRNYMLERRALIDARVGDERFYALNDVVLRSCGGHMIVMEVRVDGELIDKFKCDGFDGIFAVGGRVGYRSQYSRDRAYAHKSAYIAHAPDSSRFVRADHYDERRSGARRTVCGRRARRGTALRRIGGGDRLGQERNVRQVR